MTASGNTVLAIDPGTAKCGLAVVRRRESQPSPPEVLHREIVDTARIAERVAEVVGEFAPDVVVVGDATGSAAVRGVLEGAAIPNLPPVRVVPEAYTSERARRRYLSENPPRNVLARLVPPGMRTPDVPYDDYVAVLLAEDFFARVTAAK